MATDPTFNVCFDLLNGGAIGRIRSGIGDIVYLPRFLLFFCLEPPYEALKLPMRVYLCIVIGQAE